MMNDLTKQLPAVLVGFAVAGSIAVVAGATLFTANRVGVFAGLAVAGVGVTIGASIALYAFGAATEERRTNRGGY